jgi:hypothetical protein
VTEEKKLPEVQTVVAKDNGDGSIRLSLVIDNKFHQFNVKRSIAINIIKAVAGSLDDKLHAV